MPTYPSETYAHDTRPNVTIEGPYHRFIHRCDRHWGAFRDADRAYRKQFLADQVFTANDGKLNMHLNPGYRKYRLNIFRRAYRAPMDFVQKYLFQNLMGMGFNQARYYRLSASFAAKIYLAVLACGYYSVSGSLNDWTREGGWKSYDAPTPIYPGHEEWPHNTSQKKAKNSDYGLWNFKKSEFYKLEQEREQK